jgi:hypothetical protein
MRNRWTTAAAVLVVVVAASCAVALAARQTYTGSFNGQPSSGAGLAIGFKHGHPSGKGIFSFNNTISHCAGAPGEDVPQNGAVQDVTVKHKQGKWTFKGTEHSASEDIKLTGSFSHSLKKITGELDYTRQVETVGPCSFKNLGFTAKKS